MVKSIDEAAYFAQLERSGERVEYWDGELRDVGGDSAEHYEVESRLFGELVVRLRGTDCGVMPSGCVIAVPGRDAYVFADASVVCGPKVWMRRGGVDCLMNPTVVVEVMSERSALYDATHKLEAYSSIESLREYVRVATHLPLVVLYSRESHSSVWRTALYSEPEDEFVLSSCGLRMRVGDVYGVAATRG